MNTREEISKIVFEIMGKSNETVSLYNTNLNTEFAFDSLMIIELITLIEEKFEIEFNFDDLDLEKIFDFEHLVKNVESYLKVQ